MTGPEGIDHIDIVVADVAQMRAFFELLGFVTIRETTHGGGAVELRFPGVGDQPILELTPQSNGEVTRPLGLRHMALHTPDLDGLVSSMREHGLRLEGPPRQIPETGRRLVNVIDPAGNVVQIVERSP